MAIPVMALAPRARIIVSFVPLIPTVPNAQPGNNYIKLTVRIIVQLVHTLILTQVIIV